MESSEYLIPTDIEEHLGDCEEQKFLSFFIAIISNRNMCILHYIGNLEKYHAFINSLQFLKGYKGHIVPKHNICFKWKLL